MKLKCIISGKEVNVSPKVFADRATKYGVVADNLKTNYVSRESKRLIREGKSVDQIRTESGVAGLNPVDQAILDTLLSKKVVRASRKPKADAEPITQTPAATV